jgi:hypothetical protein
LGCLDFSFWGGGVAGFFFMGIFNNFFATIIRRINGSMAVGNTPCKLKMEALQKKFLVRLRLR